VSKSALVPLLWLLVTTVAIASGPERDEREEEALRDGCDRTQTYMNICSFYDYKVLDSELNSLYKQQLQRLGNSAARRRLIAAQRAWLKYIESDCMYQTGPREESGSIWPLQHNVCMAAHFKQRIELLRSYVECTQNGCPSE
jgi:uncharacterized protein YecT (DUF1311 family)